MKGPDSTTSIETVPVRPASTSSQIELVSANTVPATPITTSRRMYQRRRPMRSPVAGEQDRDDCGAGDERAEHDPDLHARVAEVGEGDADEDAAEPVGERAQRLNEENPPGVGSEAAAHR